MPKTNQCGGCTACCDTFPVDWLNKAPNTRCIHACEEGCAIHIAKPAECSDFECMWVQTSAPPELRPDRCGVIFEKLSDRIVYGTVSKISMKGAEQARAFQEQGFSVILFANQGGSSRFLICLDHDEDEIRAEFRQLQEVRYGDLRH